MIGLRTVLERSETVMQLTTLLSSGTPEHLQLDACGFETMPQLEASVRELQRYFKRMWDKAPARAREFAEEATGSKEQTGASHVTQCRAEAYVDLDILGHRIWRLVDMCGDSNLGLESTCISVQRSGVGFVNSRDNKIQDHEALHETLSDANQPSEFE